MQKFIKNIDSIKDCGVFYEWPKGQISFGRYNLLYGWNGCGKTTLSRIFRSLEKEAIDPALSKNDANPIFQFLQLDDSIVKSSNLSGWKDHVRVFNRDFIEDNIHADVAEAEPVYHLGEDQGEALAELKEVETELETKTSDRDEKKKELGKQENKRGGDITDKATVIREAIAMSNYNAGKLRPKLEEFRENNVDTDKLKLNPEELQETLTAARNSNDKDRIEDNLQFSSATNIKDLHKASEAVCKRSVTKAVIEELDNNNRLREWTETGHNLHKERDICAFCDSKISQERRKLLDQYFNTAYEQLIGDVGEEKESIKTFIESIKTISLPDESRLYNELREKYKESKDALGKVSSDFVTVCKKLSHSLDVKRSSKLTEEVSVAPLEELEKAQTDFLHGLEGLQSIIDSHNEKYDNFEKKAQEAKDRIISHYSADHYSAYLQTSEAIEKLEEILAPLDKAIKELEKKKAELEAQLSEHHIAVERINELLASFIGRNDIELVTNEKGYFIEREGVKAEHLSEGERTAIAFTYFIAKMEEKDFEIENSIIVIDDPISSLDTNALYAAGSFIRCHLENASQIFILTHNYQFFREIFGWIKRLKNPDKDKWHDGVPYKSHIMLKCETGEDGKRASRPYKMDKTLEKYESEYLFLFKQLYEAYETVKFTGEDNPDEIAKLMLLPNIARRVLEIFVLFKFPDVSTGSVINLYTAIKPLSVKVPPEKISILDRVLNKVSHGREEGVDSINMLDISETPKAVQYVLEFIKEADSLHFEGLEKAIGCKKKAVPPCPPPNDNQKKAA
jgi:wobble nucleotide-excising tRNase